MIYLIGYCSSTASSSEGAEAIGVAIGIAMIMPHAVVAGIAVIFNWVGFALSARWGGINSWNFVCCVYAFNANIFYVCCN